MSTGNASFAVLTTAAPMCLEDEVVVGARGVVVPAAKRSALANLDHAEGAKPVSGGNPRLLRFAAWLQIGTASLALLLGPWLHAQTPGTKRWEFVAGDRVGSSPAIGADGTVYVGSYDNTVYALDGTTGARRWEFATDRDVGSSPAIGADGTVYSNDAPLDVLDGATGIRRWSFWGTDNLTSPAIGADGTLYMGSGGNKVFALDGATGVKRWEFATGGPVRSTPAIGADGTVYVGSDDNKVYALDGATGAKRWEFATGDYVFSSPAVGADGRVYVGSGDHKVYALDGATGAKRWEFATGWGVASSPVIGTDGTVYVGSGDNKVYALDGATGAKRWGFAAGDNVYSSPAIGADGTVYVGSWDKKVYALDGATGAKRWEFLTGSWVRSSPAIGADGTVYVGSDDGKVYALWSTSESGLADSPWPMRGQNPRHTGRASTGPLKGEILCRNPRPESRTSVRLTASTLGAYPRRYQWSLGQIPIAGGTNFTYAVSAATLEQSGEYRLWVSNSFGAVTLGPVTVRVVKPGTPRVTANGQLVLTSTTCGASAVVEMTTTFSGGSIFYTTDGSAPTFASIAYTGAFTITRTTTVRAIAYSADFTQSAEELPLEIRIVPTYTVAVSVAGQGSVTLSPNQARYLEGATVTATAVSAVGWRFGRWGGDLSGTVPTNVLTVNMNKAILAVFEAIPRYALTSFTAGGGGIQGNTGSPYYEGTTVTLKATNAPGWQFMYWRGDASGTQAEVTLTMDRAKTVEAVFGTAVNTTAVGSGTVSLSPLAGPYAFGSTVLVVGQPSVGNYLARWGNAGSGTFNPLAFVVTNANPTISALFAPIPSGQVLLTVPVVGNGWVTANPAKNLFTAGDTVTLTAVPGLQQAFAGWSAGAAGQELTVTTTMDRSKTVTATFVAGYSLQVNLANAKGVGIHGQVARGPDLPVYVPGRTVTLTAVADAGWAFSRWSGDLTGTNSPAVLTMDEGKTVTATFTALPGTKLWEFTTGGYVHSSPAVGADGTVFVGSYDHKVYALDGATGGKRWEFTTGSIVYSSPAIGEDGTVYVGSEDDKVYALDGATGAKRWEFATGNGVSSSPAIGVDGTVYVGSYDTKVYALDGTTGAKRWEFLTGAWVRSPPAIGVDGTVYVGSSDPKVYALDGTTGAKRWSFPKGTSTSTTRPVSSPAIGFDGTVYLGSDDHRVYALDGATGAKRWEFVAGAGGSSSPVIGADGTVYAGSEDNKVYALDGATGAKRWEFLTGGEVYSSPAIGADGTVFVGSGDHKVYALDGATGAKRWEFLTGHYVSSSPAIGADGAVYVGSDDGKVYALQGSAPPADSPWPMFHQNAQHTGRARAYAPVIRSQSQSESVVAGNDLTATADVTGTPPLSYQWQFNGGNILGATNAELVLRAVSPDETGAYSVTVTNHYGAATGPIVVLSVQYSLTTRVSGPGTVLRGPDAASYTPSTMVTLTAVPQGRFTFVGWSGDAAGFENPLLLKMDTNKAVAAHFGAPTNLPPPTVSLSSPTNGAEFRVPEAIAISALAVVPGGVVGQVDFYDGTNLIATVSTSPFASTWTNAAPGIHVLTARATDDLGRVATSNPVTVTVDPPPGEPALSLFPPEPPTHAGSLVISLKPAGTGAQWRFPWEPAWRDGDTLVSGLVLGNYEVEFKPVAGFIQPPNTFVAVSPGSQTTVTNYYVATAAPLFGALTVTIQPASVAQQAQTSSRGQWRRQGETLWHDSGETITNLTAGVYLVEFKSVTDWVTPSLRSVSVFANQGNSIAATYYVGDSTTGTKPAPLLFPDITTRQTDPYAYSGQILSEVGYGSGFVVKERVVLTASHVLFNDATFSYVSGAKWFFQRHKGVYEPKPQTPRGWYVFDGYAAQRQVDNSPGRSSPESQNLDVAAMFFLEPSGRGGYGGYLSSDADANEWLLSDRDKVLVGYPVEGVSEGDRSKMHATVPLKVSFQRVIGRVYATVDVTSYPGNSGGPMCVKFDNGKYYPAAVYLGGSAQTVVRGIDSQVVNLINRAEVSGNGGGNSVGGGVNLLLPSLTNSAFAPGFLSVTLAPPAAVQAGAGWRIVGGDTNYTSDTLMPLLPADYTVDFKPVAGFGTPGQRVVQVTTNQTTTVQADYAPAGAPALSFDRTAGLVINGAVGKIYRIDYSTNLNLNPANRWTPLATNTLSGGSLPIPNTRPNSAGTRFYRAVLVP